MILPRHCLLAIAAVLDVALHARPEPVPARQMAERIQLPPRHLEQLLQRLVHARILKSARGPKGGYELVRERRKISLGQIVRAVEPLVEEASLRERHGLMLLVAEQLSGVMQHCLEQLHKINIDDLCRQHASQSGEDGEKIADFTI